MALYCDSMFSAFMDTPYSKRNKGSIPDKSSGPDQDPIRGRARGGGDSGGSSNTENLNKGSGPDQGPIPGKGLVPNQGPVRGRVRGGDDSGGFDDTKNLNKGKGSSKGPGSGLNQGPVRGCVRGGGDSGGSGDTENLDDKGDDGGALGGFGGSSPNNTSVVPDCHASDEPVSTQALSHTKVPSKSPKCPHHQVFQSKPRHTPKSPKTFCFLRNDKGGGGGALVLVGVLLITVLLPMIGMPTPKSPQHPPSAPTTKCFNQSLVTHPSPSKTFCCGGGGTLGGSGRSSPNNSSAAHDWHTNGEPVLTQVPSTSPKCPHHQVFQPKPRHIPSPPKTFCCDSSGALGGSGGSSPNNSSVAHD
ncbi:hypothetical protein KY290_035872 [Solanum tuberosum]|uniref:Uncharacterized protein n=1 Tax=Solanum tuberosum TaxID=4113 RepID=A0ABQ7TR85_SOLTU|nr:hypothetical protein KY284_037505 [Solanum tuberosum]KAH0737167.1 hypothetical protein KY290_035872 [Solanum tuberosum]